jgi:DNA-binding response OmpR family regulator
MHYENKERLLVVEDDREIADLIGRYLDVEGFTVDVAYDGLEGLRSFREHRHELVISDIAMPGLNGLDLVKEIRAIADPTILLLTARSSENEKILGLNIGADDYMTKPFSMPEVVARVHAHLRSRRRKLQVGQPLRIGPFTVDPHKRLVKKGDRSLDLRPREFDILHLLASHPNQILSKEQIYARVWKEPYLGDDNTIMVHIRRIREKIEADPSSPRWIETVWGVGYRLCEESRESS